jgi:hypothetical protein
MLGDNYFSLYIVIQYKSVCGISAGNMRSMALGLKTSGLAPPPPLPAQTTCEYLPAIASFQIHRRKWQCLSVFIV